jgi:hypothetical protein
MPTAAIDRVWCERLAAQLRKHTIRRGAAPYLDRYFVAGWSPGARRPGPAIFLHHFVGSDAREQVHSHPWAAISLLLVGAYREHRCAADGTETVRDLQAGDLNVLAPDDRHRIELLSADVWSLFLVSDVVQPWGFAPSC